ncbi:SRPBCC family protein [Saccharothrix saharensis]|uniref:SRPBCC family protein n=1 Tax=Saccharothrix saharensis TaxID=571190 RepID=UPI00368BC4FE
MRHAELSAPAPGGGFGVGAEVTRTARFLGRRIDYVLRVVAHEPPSLLEVKSVAGPFPMHVTYRFDTTPAGTTTASIRVRGDAGGHYPLIGPLVARFVRANLRKDLRDLARHVG